MHAQHTGPPLSLADAYLPTPDTALPSASALPPAPAAPLHTLAPPAHFRLDIQEGCAVAAELAQGEEVARVENPRLGPSGDLGGSRECMA